MSALAVVEQIVSIAKLSGQIAQDQACMSGLILFLDNPDPAVVLAALNVRVCMDANMHACMCFGMRARIEWWRNTGTSDSV